MLKWTVDKCFIFIFKPLCRSRSDVTKEVYTFLNKPWFFRVCSTSLLKTLWEKEKLLVTSTFSFSNNAFCHFRDISANVSSANSEFRRVQHLSFGTPWMMDLSNALAEGVLMHPPPPMNCRPTRQEESRNNRICTVHFFCESRLNHEEEILYRLKCRALIYLNFFQTSPGFYMSAVHTSHLKTRGERKNCS